MSEPDPDRQRQDWLQSVVQRYERPLLAYACRLLGGDVDRAQDAVQETLLRLCRANADAVAPRIPAWLFTVCRTRVIDMRRTEHTTTATAELVATNSLSPAAAAERQDTNQHVQSLVARLPERQQELLQLRMQAGLSYQQIADATGMTVTNVGYQIHQAVRTLRAALLAVPS